MAAQSSRPCGMIGLATRLDRHNLAEVEVGEVAAVRIRVDVDCETAVGRFARCQVERETTRPDQHSTVGAWSPLDDRVLSPPARSLVLRI